MASHYRPFVQLSPFRQTGESLERISCTKWRTERHVSHFHGRLSLGLCAGASAPIGPGRLGDAKERERETVPNKSNVALGNALVDGGHV